jgi:hypothetical protein
LCVKRHVLGLKLAPTHSKLAATTGEYGAWLTNEGNLEQGKCLKELIGLTTEKVTN